MGDKYVGLDPEFVWKIGHSAKLMLYASFIELKNGSLVISSLKKRADGDGFVLRFYEVEGKDSDAEILFSPYLCGGEVTATEADAMERAIGVPALIAEQGWAFAGADFTGKIECSR